MHSTRGMQSTAKVFILFVSYSYDITNIAETPSPSLSLKPTVSSRLVAALYVGNTITSRTQAQPRIFRNPLVATPFPHHLRPLTRERAGYITAHSGNPSRHALRDPLLVIADSSNVPPSLYESISDGVTSRRTRKVPTGLPSLRLPYRDKWILRISVATRMSTHETIQFDYRLREKS